MGVIFEFQLDLLEKLFLLLSLRLPLEETIIKPCEFDSLSLDFGELGERLELFFDFLLLLNHFIIKTNYHMESMISSSAATCRSEMKISSGSSLLKYCFTYWKAKRFGAGRERS